jgi:phage-related baseplate assembly protein
LKAFRRNKKGKIKKMLNFTAIDLSALPPPQIIETPLFENLLAENKAVFLSFLPDYATLNLESDAVLKILQVFTYRELLLIQKINDAVKSVLIAYAAGSDLDHLAARSNILRFENESDNDFRRRVQLAPEGYSVAGPAGSYIFLAYSADQNVKSVSAVSPAPCQVTVTILSKTGNGAAPQSLIDKIYAALSAEAVRPLSDQLTVSGAAIVNYTITATLKFYEGPDRALVLAEAIKAVTAYAEKKHHIGENITRAGIISALYKEGVQNVILTAPASDVLISNAQAAYCTSISVIEGGIDE